MGYTRYNIFDIYDGGVLIQPIIKKIKNNNYAAGLSAYIFLLLGMTIILYLFGYTNMFTQYLSSVNTASNHTINITNPELNLGQTVLQTLTSSFWGLLTLGGITAGIIVLGIAEMLGAFKGATATVLTYVIPIVILVVLNIFVFPISSITSELQFMEVAGLGIMTIFLILVFNITYILAVVEFIRGGNI